MYSTFFFNWIPIYPPTQLSRVVSIPIVVKVSLLIEVLCAKYLDAFFAPKELLFYRAREAPVYFKELTGAYSIYREISSYYLRLK